MESIKLTEFSPGSGCGCKISPRDLEEILRHPRFPARGDQRLLVGNDTNDDAAVFDTGHGIGLISTTDFFTPIVNDAFLFGRIAAVNAISDVYAMGGTPLMAIAILGWPLKKLPTALAKEVVEGARSVCEEVTIPLAGGHSIDISEPIFGLAVTGQVPLTHLKRNNTARPGARLFLTKPLGVGILTTAEKKGLLQPEHRGLAVESMTRLNRIGERFGALEGITALTDVTGFGLLGHLTEMCTGSGVNARVHAAAVPVLKGLETYLAQGSVPGGTRRNWASYGHLVSPLDDTTRDILCDPQTSGGLLAAVSQDAVEEFLTLAREAGLSLTSFGEILPRDMDRGGPHVEVLSD
ncbi:MAG: selenide, water dikinase SelD [Magnetococcus sp. WYHC-3]